MFLTSSLVRAATVLCLMAGSADAAIVDATSLLRDFNTIALGNLNASSETEGTVFVGGNLVSNGYGVNPRNIASGVVGSVSGSLIVGGNVSGNPINVGAGNVVIGGTNSAIINRNGGGSLTTGTSVDVSGVAAAMTGLSTYLASFGTTAGAAANTADQNLKSLVSGAGGTGDLTNIAVLNLNALQTLALLGSGNLATLNLTAGVTTIVNLAGSNLSISGNFNQDNSTVLFNFFEATNLTIGATFGFGILAPNADIVASSGGNDGVVVGRNITQNIEFRPLNNQNFTGNLPVQVSAIPLPAPALMLIAGLLSLFALRRRKTA